MPDREKVIENLEKAKTVIENWVPMFEQYNTPFGIDCAIAMLKEQKEEPNASGWISVKDRLPEKEGQYLCWFGKNTVAKGAAIATYLEMWKSFGSLESLETYPNVTHWMPIESPEAVKFDE